MQNIFKILFSSAFVSFYIDEDDFEDDSGLSSSRSRKTDKDVFVADKYRNTLLLFLNYKINFRYKPNDVDSTGSEIEEFEIKPAAKVKSKPIKKQVTKITRI